MSHDHGGPLVKVELLHLLRVVAQPLIASLANIAPRFLDKKASPSKWSRGAHLMARSL